MKNKTSSRIDCIIQMVKYFWEKRVKALERIFVPILLSSVSSVLSFLVLYFFPQIDRWTMLLAMILFLYSLFEYTFRYSFLRRHSRPYWMDVLLPWGIFSALAYFGYFFIPPKIFNYIFLPLRACESFYLRSWFSILIVLIFMLLLMTITRSFGRRIQLQYHRERH